MNKNIDIASIADIFFLMFNWIVILCLGSDVSFYFLLCNIYASKGAIRSNSGFLFGCVKECPD